MRTAFYNISFKEENYTATIAEVTHNANTFEILRTMHLLSNFEPYEKWDLTLIEFKYPAIFVINTTGTSAHYRSCFFIALNKEKSMSWA